MEDKPKLIVYEERTLIVGQNTFVDSLAESNNGVVFEDSGETGYFYAVERKGDLKILDALHIYNVADVIDKDKPSLLKILWTEDLNRAFLSINNYYHAAFDFKNRAGYCRTGFPAPGDGWALVPARMLTDELLTKLAKNG